MVCTHTLNVLIIKNQTIQFTFLLYENSFILDNRKKISDRFKTFIKHNGEFCRKVLKKWVITKKRRR